MSDTMTVVENHTNTTETNTSTMQLTTRAARELGVIDLEQPTQENAKNESGEGSAPKFEYGVARVRDLHIETQLNESTGRSHVRHLLVNDEVVRPTQRFWTSFFHRFGISETIFRYFSHAEVFQRIAAQAKTDRFRFCIQRNQRGQAALLAVTNPARPIISYDEIMGLVQRYNGGNVQYSKGVITSTYTPRSGEVALSIGADEFRNRFVMDTPIDGYGNPRIHLSLLRLLCSNGAIGYSKAFRSEINVGKEVAYSLARALETFDNGEGYAALRDRFRSAQESWASLNECNKLYKMLAKLKTRGDLSVEGLLGKYCRLTGDLQGLYGFANLDALSVKRQRVLPAKCRVYDLLNFASETATHFATAEGNRGLQAFIGDLISDEFDMEGTAQKMVDFDDFFIDSDRPHTSPSKN